MSRSRPVLAVLLLATLDGCAAAACTPVTIVVVDKDERARLRQEPRGLRTDELGRVKQVYREVITREYWVRDREGRWYRLGEAAWRAVEPGQPVQVCR
jgi:hypothetical protein